MITLIYRNAANTISATYKVDMFASIPQLLDPNFTTRCTVMEQRLVGDAIQAGLDFSETEYSLADFRTRAVDTADFGLFAVDSENISAGETELIPFNEEEEEG